MELNSGLDTQFASSISDMVWVMIGWPSTQAQGIKSLPNYGQAENGVTVQKEPAAHTPPGL